MFTTLLMRERVLPSLIREARTAPIRSRISQLEGEMSELGDEQQRTRNAPLPELTEMQRLRQTPRMVRDAELSGVLARSGEITRQLRELRKQLSEAEGGNARP